MAKRKKTGEHMRIYLTEARRVIESVDGGSEIERIYPRAGFYNTPTERAHNWIDEGVAFEASDDNKVLAWRPEHDAAELVDIAAGESLDGLHSKFQPLPEEEDPAEVDESADTEDLTAENTDVVFSELDDEVT